MRFRYLNLLNCVFRSVQRQILVIIQSYYMPYISTLRILSIFLMVTFYLIPRQKLFIFFFYLIIEYKLFTFINITIYLLTPIYTVL